MSDARGGAVVEMGDREELVVKRSGLHLQDAVGSVCGWIDEWFERLVKKKMINSHMMMRNVEASASMRKAVALLYPQRQGSRL